MRNIIKTVLCAGFLLTHTQLTLNAMEEEDFDESKTEQPQVNSDAPLQDFLRCIEVYDFSAGHTILKENLHIVSQYPAHSGIFLGTAIFMNDLEMTKNCVTSGADVNSAVRFPHPHYTYPLNWAVFYSREKIAKFLLDCGANVFAERSDGKTVLYTVLYQACSSYDYPDNCISMLVRYGANLLDNNQRQTLLDLAPRPEKRAAIEEGLRQRERDVLVWLSSDYNPDAANVIKKLPRFFSSMIGGYI